MKIKPKLEISKDRNIYFVGDLHYNHENVIKFDNRPFNSVNEMNEFIVKNLKETLKPNDILFDLGDMFWKESDDNIRKVLEEIPTKNIYKIIGNHDNYQLFSKNLRGYFIEVGDIFDVNIKYLDQNYKVILSHFPLITWQSKAYGSIHLHAHCHGNLDKFNNDSTDLRADIGFNSEISKINNSFIIPFSKVIEYFNNKTSENSFFNWVKDNNQIL